MKLFKKIRKGFTLIELVVVIAVIAILSAVSIVSYVSITNKAKQSNDQQKVDQVNLSLASAEVSAKPKTMSEALEAIEADGFTVEKFKAEAKNYEFGYAMEENRVVIIEKGNKVVYPKDYQQGVSANVWRFAAGNGDVKNDGFSYYLLDGCTGSISTEVNGGLDVGKNKDISAFTVKSSQEKLVIFSGGDQCIATINAPSADIDFYGFAKRVDVKAVKGSSLHIYGSVGELQLEQGHAKVESTGIVFDVVQIGAKSTGDGATLTNNGFIAETSLSEHEVGGVVPAAVEAEAKSNMDGKEKSKTLEVGSLAQLEAFRDAVNSGNNFKGLIVKLTKDIALSDGWRPIGEGSRSVEASNVDAYNVTTFFAGTFDGQDHTISNLNNKGFIPNDVRLVEDTFGTEKLETYSYGLFALVNNATITHVKLTNVDIDQSRYSGAVIDSAAGLIGFSQGSLTVSDVTVSGSAIKGQDCISGIVGRIKAGANTISITKCTASIDLDSTVASCGIARIYKGESGHNVTISNNAYVGAVTTSNTNDYNAGIALINKITTLTHTGNTVNNVAADEVTGVQGGNSVLGLPLED